MTIRIGVGGWTYEPWRGEFFPPDLPQKSELEYASRRLSSIEINGTYYGSQKPESFQRWHDDTPDDFMFSVKGPRFATNRRVLGEARESVDRFFASGVTRLGAKLGPINWQFTPWKKFEAEDFGAFLDLLPREHDGLPIRHAVEVRHASFRCAQFVDLARARGVAIIVAGDSDYPQIPDITAPFVYARIMGTQEGVPQGYDAAGLQGWATRAREWAAGRVPQGLEAVAPAPASRPGELDVFIYVISGHKVSNPAAAMGLMDRLGLARAAPPAAAAAGKNTRPAKTAKPPKAGNAPKAEKAAASSAAGKPGKSAARKKAATSR